MNDVEIAAWANAVANGDLIYIQTFSGYRSCRSDPQGKKYLFKPTASDEELGAAILDALAHSRFVRPREDKTLYDYKLTNERYIAWVEKMQSTFGYKTRRELFKDMKNCSIQLRDSVVDIYPTNHDRLEGWSGDGISEEDRVLIHCDRTLEEIGAALRLGFRRCK